MHIQSLFVTGAAALALAACGKRDAAPAQDSRSANAAVGEQAGADHSATGKITGVAGDTVTISHGPIAGLGWPAMTMGFRAPSPEMLGGVKPGDPVSFAFRQSGSDYVLTSLTKGE